MHRFECCNKSWTTNPRCFCEKLFSIWERCDDVFRANIQVLKKCFFDLIHFKDRFELFDVQNILRNIARYNDRTFLFLKFWKELINLSKSAKQVVMLYGEPFFLINWNDATAIKTGDEKIWPGRSPGTFYLCAYWQ